MALEVVWDTVANARVEQNGLAVRVLRGVAVNGINGLTTPDPEILMRGRDAVLASAGLAYPGRPELIFVGLSLQGFTSDGVSGYGVYETFAGGAPTTQIIRSTSYIGASETDFIPGSRIPIKIAYKSNTRGIEHLEDKVTMRFMRPMAALSASGLTYGPPPNLDAYVGYVNKPSWGPPGKVKPVGYWMIAKYDTALSKYQGYSTYECVLISRNYEDWSECGVMVNTQTGKHVEVADSDVTTAVSRDYAYGIIWGSPTSPGEFNSGIIRVGGNPTVDFSSIGL